LPAIRRRAYKGSVHAVDDGFPGLRRGGWMMHGDSELARVSRTARGDGARHA
jgi:hypothetical protein